MTKKPNVIFDLDGTLCDLSHRLPHLNSSPKNWEAFHSGCVNDAPKQDVIALTHILYMFHNVYILSGRNGKVEAETRAWLTKHRVAYNHLIMRPENDRRDDVDLKRKMAREAGLTPANTLVVFDDRQRVVDMWREDGFTCCQVAQWKE
jgi:uncharacterized HAD superfamily protein